MPSRVLMGIPFLTANGYASTLLIRRYGDVISKSSNLNNTGALVADVAR